MVEALARHGRRHQIDAFLAQGDGCGWCRHPIRLRGYAIAGPDGDRKVVFSSASLPDGVMLKACGSRSELQCPSCAAIYRGDSRHLVRAGLEGGKGVDEAVATHPAVFLTLTAPGFGAVHGTQAGSACHTAHQPAIQCRHGRPLSCTTVMESPTSWSAVPSAPIVTTTSALFCRTPPRPSYGDGPPSTSNASSPPSSDAHRFRRPAPFASPRVGVADFQCRGLVHLHAVVRADGPDRALPALDGWQLAQACAQAVRSVSVSHPRRVARWGDELDVQVLEPGDDTAARIVTYIAKYATKSSGEHPGLEHRILSVTDLERRALPAHLHRMVANGVGPR